MDKNTLIQCREMNEEIKDIHNRINAIERSIHRLSIVSDSVKGTREDGTYGSIRITGYPIPKRYLKEKALKQYQAKLEVMEARLLELTIQAEEFIESIEKSELRIMFRLYYLDGLTWVQVAHRMNKMLPGRRVKFTEDSCRMRNARFFEEN